MMMTAMAPRENKGFRLFGVYIQETEKKPLALPWIHDQKHCGGVDKTQTDDLSLRLGSSSDLSLSLSLGFHVPAKPLKEEKMTEPVLFSGNNGGIDGGVVAIPEIGVKQEPPDENFDEFGDGKRYIPESLLPIKKRRFWSGTVMGSHGMIQGCSLQGNFLNRVKVEDEADQRKGKKRKTVGSDSDLPLKKKRQLYAPIHTGNLVAEVPEVVVLPPADLKDKVISIGGIESSMRLVIEKQLTVTDVNPKESRMSMPRKQTSLHLDTSEQEIIEGRDEKSKPKGIDVVVIDPKLEKHKLAFKKWYFENKQWMYVFCGAWSHLRKDNSLNKNDTIRVWSFRMEEGHKLAFAISKIGQGIA